MATMNQRRPMDAPLEDPAHHEKPTGLLTRFVPARFQHSKFYGLFLRLTRVLQFLSSVISLGVFSQRLFKVYRLVNSIKTRRGVNGSYGAVEGILAAAVLYTLITTILGCIKKNSSPGTKGWLRWLWVVLDILFVGAFIAVSVITSPNGGMAGPRHCYSEGRLSDGSNSATGETASTDETCNLPWGTFISFFVIVSSTPLQLPFTRSKTTVAEISSPLPRRRRLFIIHPALLGPSVMDKLDTTPYLRQAILATSDIKYLDYAFRLAETAHTISLSSDLAW